MRQKDILELLSKYKNASLKRVKKDVCGKRIGAGVSREVYEFVHDRRYVVKIDHLKEHDNIMEWRMWQDTWWFKHVRILLAPCLWISSNGRVLIQRRVTFTKKHLYPQKLPNMFSDLKYQNYGWLNNKFKCCDYSRMCYWRTGQLRKVKWHNGCRDIRINK